MAENIIEVWHAGPNNTLAKRHRTDIDLNTTAVPPTPPTDPTTDRDLLVYGTYKPDASNTGVLDGTTLVDYGNSSVNTVTISSETHLVSRKIWGDVIINTGAPVTFTNCLFVGGANVPSTGLALLYCDRNRSGSAANVIVKDCTFAPRRPSLNRDGIRGHRFEVYRSEITSTVDAFSCFRLSSQGTETNVKIMGNWVHDLVYFYPDYDNGVDGATQHTDGTHNDGVQVQGGENIQIKGNFFQGTGFKGVGSGDNPASPWIHTGTYKFASGSGILIQKQSTTAALGNVVAENNWLEGWLGHFNMKPGTYTYRNNLHSRIVAIGPGRSGYWIRGDNKSQTTVNELYTSNRWEDNNVLLAEPRTNGIHWNA